MKTPTLHDVDGSERELPYKWVICSHCRGEGTSSAYLGAFTSCEWGQQDPEWQQDYIAGRFDRPCEHCENGKVKVADFSHMSKQDAEAYREELREEHEYQAMVDAERKMGA